MMSPSGNVTVVIADDTLIAREGWKRIVETSNDIQIIGEVITAQQVVRDVTELRPDVVLMDLLWYGDENAGWMAIHEIKQQHGSKVRIIAITAYEHLIRDARRAGADAALLKTFTREQLLNEILRQANREDLIVTATAPPSIVSIVAGKLMQLLQKLRR